MTTLQMQAMVPEVCGSYLKIADSQWKRSAPVSTAFVRHKDSRITISLATGVGFE